MPVNPVNLWLPPKYAEGRNVAKSLARGDYLVRSAPILFSASSPVSVFTVPANTLVTEAMCQIITAFDGLLPSVSLGVAGTTGRHLTTADVDTKLAGFYGPLVPRVFEYTAATTITATLLAVGATVGKLVFWLEFRTYTDQWAQTSLV